MWLKNNLCGTENMSYGSLLYRMKRLIGGSTANSEIYKNFTLTYRRDLCQIQYEPHEPYIYINHTNLYGM